MRLETLQTGRKCLERHVLREARAQTAMGIKFFNCESQHRAGSMKRLEKERGTRSGCASYAEITLNVCVLNSLRH